MSGQDEWIAYVNGEYIPQSQAKVSIFDHGLLYGDGVFDSWCAWNGNLFMMDEHIDRLYRSIHFFKIDMPLSKEELSLVFLRCWAISTYPSDSMPTARRMRNMLSAR